MPVLTQAVQAHDHSSAELGNLESFELPAHYRRATKAIAEAASTEAQRNERDTFVVAATGISTPGERAAPVSGAHNVGSNHGTSRTARRHGAGRFGHFDLLNN
jgi:hypothetical protein